MHTWLHRNSRIFMRPGRPFGYDLRHVGRMSVDATAQAIWIYRCGSPLPPWTWMLSAELVRDLMVVVHLGLVWVQDPAPEISMREFHAGPSHRAHQIRGGGVLGTGCS